MRKREVESERGREAERRLRERIVGDRKKLQREGERVMIKLHRDPSRKISQTARVQLRPEALGRATRRDLLQIKSLHMAFDLMNCWENQ